MDPSKPSSTPPLSSSSSSRTTGLSSAGSSSTLAASTSPSAAGAADVHFATGVDGANRRFYPLSTACAKALTDKVYDKRKVGATEVEK